MGAYLYAYILNSGKQTSDAGERGQIQHAESTHISNVMCTGTEQIQKCVKNIQGRSPEDHVQEDRSTHMGSTKQDTNRVGIVIVTAIAQRRQITHLNIAGASAW